MDYESIVKFTINTFKYCMVDGVYYINIYSKFKMLICKSHIWKHLETDLETFGNQNNGFI